MGLFGENFPYTNFHDLNLDWILQKMKEVYNSNVYSVNGKKGDVEITGADVPISPENPQTINESVEGMGEYVNQQVGALTELVNTFNDRINEKAKKNPTKVVCYGDSIMYGLLGDFTKSEHNWPDEMGRILDIEVTNNAYSGASMSNYDEHSFINLVDTIPLDPYDMIIIGYGFNDVGHGVPIDGTDNGGFRYAYENAIKTIMTRKPSMQIVLCTTTFSGGLTWRYAPSQINADDVNNVILDLAQKYRLPCIDFVHNSGVNSNNYQSLTWDGLHYTNDGYIKLARFASSVLNSQNRNIYGGKFIVHTIDTTDPEATSGQRFTMYFDNNYPHDMIKILSFCQHKKGFCISVILAQATQMGIEMKADGTMEFIGGAVALHPDENSAVSMALDTVDSSKISGQFYWYGDVGTITTMVLY